MLNTSTQQWYVDVSDSGGATPEYVRVTDNEGFNPTNEDAKYSPKYKCAKTNPEMTTGRKTNIDFDIDVIEDQELQDWLREHEDDINVPTSVIRQWTFPDGTVDCKKGDFLMNENPIDGEAEGVLKATGIMSMESDGWTKGDFDPETGKFTPKAEVNG